MLYKTPRTLDGRRTNVGCQLEMKGNKVQKVKKENILRTSPVSRSIPVKSLLGRILALCSKIICGTNKKQRVNRETIKLIPSSHRKKVKYDNTPVPNNPGKNKMKVTVSHSTKLHNFAHYGRKRSISKRRFLMQFECFLL